MDLPAAERCKALPEERHGKTWADMEKNTVYV